ncbi:MAG: Tol-Pal system beta propeller repeat protein TolB [Thermodesulfovibrionia bacterium]
MKPEDKITDKGPKDRKGAIRYCLLFSIICLLSPLICPLSEAKVYIDITSPGLRKLPISIRSKGDDKAKAVEEIVRDDLIYTGLFDDVTTDMPPEIKIEIELMGSDNIEAIVNVMDVIEDRSIFKKRYEATKDIIRALGHSISNDVFEAITGIKGAFRTKIAYIQQDPSGEREIYLMDWDGHNQRPLVSGGLISSHHWSMDGRYIVYSSEINKSWRIYLIDLERFEKRMLFQSRGLNLVGNISGNQLLFSSSKDGSPEIYIMDINSSNYRKLTHSYGIDVSPVLSPDGMRVAFVSDRGGSPQIYIMDMKEGSVSRLTFEGNYNTSPAWSPDGKWIAFSGRVGGKNQIFLIKSDGTGLRQLTDRGNNEEPSFSPDGLFIVFSSDRDGEKGIYQMRTNGEGQRRLSQRGVMARLPRWSPYKY